MDQHEVIALEQKTREIVATLKALKAELEKQKDVRELLNRDHQALLKSANSLSKLSDSSQDVLELIKKGTFENQISLLKGSIEGLEGIYDGVGEWLDLIDQSVSDQSSAINSLEKRYGKIEAKMNAAAESIDGIAASIDKVNKTLARIETTCSNMEAKYKSLEAMIGRIDRNTQKGFGKERA